MPWTGYCKKCGAETPVADTCAHCGAKLTKSAQRFSTYAVRTPVKDWFCWNSALRVTLPVYALVVAVFLLLEACTHGITGIRALLAGSFPSLMLALLAGLTLLIFLALLAQGQEVVKTVLDKDGARQWCYVRRPSWLRLTARLAGKDTLAALREQADALDGYSAVRQRGLLWTDCRRVREWPEERVLLLYRPRGWTCLSVRLSADEYGEALAYMQKKCHIKAAPKRPAKRRANGGR